MEGAGKCNHEAERTLSRKFSKEETQIANEYFKNCSTSLVIRGMQIKTILRSTSPQSLRNLTTNTGKDFGERSTLIYC